MSVQFAPSPADPPRGRPVRIERGPERAVSPDTIMRLEHARAALPDGTPLLGP